MTGTSTRPFAIVAPMSRHAHERSDKDGENATRARSSVYPMGRGGSGIRRQIAWYGDVFRVSSAYGHDASFHAGLVVRGADHSASHRAHAPRYGRPFLRRRYRAAKKSFRKVLTRTLNI